MRLRCVHVPIFGRGNEEGVTVFWMTCGTEHGQAFGVGHCPGGGAVRRRSFDKSLEGAPRGHGGVLARRRVSIPILAMSYNPSTDVFLSVLCPVRFEQSILRRRPLLLPDLN